MEIKLFGKSIFNFSKGNTLYELSQNTVRDSKYLIDFESSIMNGFISIESSISISGATEENKKQKDKNISTVTPKEIFQLKTLNDDSFVLKTDSEYVNEQLQSFKDKLSLISLEEYDMRNGTNQIASIVSRLENRKKYKEHKEFYEQFPYTTTEKINALIKKHENLKLGQVAQFIADMPKEAVDVMKQYNEETKKLCGKLPVYYLIADKKDFQKTESRKDPILLAQSPFAHVWQILGAWDEEMLFLGDL